jgi:hypothetical protein
MARTLLLCIGLFFAALQTEAAEFYVDPVNGSPSGVGSRQVVGVVLCGNTIINYDDLNQPYRGTLLGIVIDIGAYEWHPDNVPPVEESIGGE